VVSWCSLSVEVGRVRAVVTYGVKLQRSDDLQLDDHPDACTEETFAEWCAQRRGAGERLAVDLFSGAGGLSLGLHEAGWTVAVAVDNDPKALQTHRHNFPGLTLAHDLADPDERRSFLELVGQTEIDLVAGGPPCQPFSRAGRSKIRSLVETGHRPAHDNRRELWRAYLEIALELRPRAVLMENVPDMALGDDFFVVRTMVEELESAGYHTQVRLIDAWRHGVPQHRKRLILLGRLDTDTFTWPAAVKPEPRLRDAIMDLPELGEGTGARQLPYRRRRLSDFARRMREGMTEAVVWDHMTRPVRDDDRQIFEMMDSTTLYAKLPAHLRRYSAETFDDKYKKLDWDERSRSITAHIAKDGYWYIHPKEYRTLTVREAARIQTFPDRFRFGGTRSDAFRQIGNAVPPLLGQAAALALIPLTEPAPAVPPCQWRAAREALAGWAKNQQSGPHWYLLPGRGMTPAVAAVTAVLLGRATPAQGSERALAAIRGRARLDVGDLVRMELELPTAPGRAAVEKFRPFTRKRKIWADPDALVAALGMKSSQERMFRLLCGQDVLLANQAAFRVAARVAGSESNKVNRMSDGRVDLARLVGAGHDAPLRTAALRLLGSTLCREPGTLCKDCPLRSYCAKADQNPLPEPPEPQPTLF
jgi:DNA (cytosine-5)-methyltransferase 1